MKYMGGKTEIADELTAIIKDRHPERALLIEPFMGGGNMTVALAPLFKEVRSYDLHPDLILMWQALKEGWVPPADMSEVDYNDLSYADPSALRGFAGFAGSFGAKWFGGYARGETNAGSGRNYFDETKRSLLRDIAKMQNVTFTNTDFSRVPIVKGAVIYADPPYSGTTKYMGSYSPIRFWYFMRKWASLGATVYVSEYRAPDDVPFIWEKALNGRLKKQNSAVERLFVLEASGA